MCSIDYQDAVMNPDGIFAGYTALTWLAYILNIALSFVPCLGSYVRRLHDIGRSGWWTLPIYILLIIPLINIVGIVWFLVWFCKDSEKATNKWGISPKYKTDIS